MAPRDQSKREEQDQTRERREERLGDRFRKDRSSAGRSRAAGGVVPTDEEESATRGGGAGREQRRRFCCAFGSLWKASWRRERKRRAEVAESESCRASPHALPTPPKLWVPHRSLSLSLCVRSKCRILSHLYLRRIINVTIK